MPSCQLSPPVSRQQKSGPSNPTDYSSSSRGVVAASSPSSITALSPSRELAEATTVSPRLSHRGLRRLPDVSPAWPLDVSSLSLEFLAMMISSVGFHESSCGVSDVSSLMFYALSSCHLPADSLPLLMTVFLSRRRPSCGVHTLIPTLLSAGGCKDCPAAHRHPSLSSHCDTSSVCPCHMCDCHQHIASL